MNLNGLCKRLFSVEETGKGIVAKVEYVRYVTTSIPAGWGAGSVTCREYLGSEPPASSEISSGEYYYIVTLTEREGSVKEKVELLMSHYKDVEEGMVVRRFRKFLKIPLHHTYKVDVS